MNVWFHHNTELRSHINGCSPSVFFHSQLKAELTIPGWTRTCNVVKALTVLGHNLKTGTAEIHRGSEYYRFQGQEMYLAFYYIWLCSQNAISLLFTWMGIVCPTNHHPSILNCQGFTVTGNLELGQSEDWILADWREKLPLSIKGVVWVS